MTEITCENCGNSNREEALFCDNCGSRLRTPADTKAYAQARPAELAPAAESGGAQGSSFAELSRQDVFEALREGQGPAPEADGALPVASQNGVSERIVIPEAESAPEPLPVLAPRAPFNSEQLRRYAYFTRYMSFFALGVGLLLAALALFRAETLFLQFSGLLAGAFMAGIGFIVLQALGHVIEGVTEVGESQAQIRSLFEVQDPLQSQELE